MRVLALAVALCACGDDISLRVVVRHPTGVEVGLTTVTVYESASVTCIDLAFARLGADELDALKVTEQSIDANGEASEPLSGISRVDHKLIVARGFSMTGAWITAGCAEHDVVDETTRIEIDTEPTVTASPVLDVDPMDPLLAVLATTDASGKPVTDRRVAWSVYGPAGSMPTQATDVTLRSDGVWEPTKPSCTQAQGAAGLHPPPPSAIGGYSVQLRAEWSVDLPARYSRMLIGAGDLTLSPPAQSKKYCAIRVSGATTRVVCLDGGSARDFEVSVSGGTVAFAQRGMVTVPADALAVVAVPSGADRDVYMISRRGALMPLFGAPAPDNSDLPCPTTVACDVEDVIAVPPCGATPGKLLVKTSISGPGQVKEMNARGGGTQVFPLGGVVAQFQIQLDNAGCVTRVDPSGGAPTLRQVITFHAGTRDTGGFTAMGTRAVYNCNATSCMANEMFPGAGVAFTTGSEPRMLATFVDASGVVVAEVVMAPDSPQRDLFVERSRSPAAGIPDRAVVGNFDGDTELDWFWNTNARRGATFEVAYAREVERERLEALSSAQPIAVTSLASGDLTGDGHDDLMIIGDAIGPAAAKLSVVPMFTAAPPIAVPSDSTCSK